MTQEQLLFHFLTKHEIGKEQVAHALRSGVTLFGPNSLRKSLAKRDFLYFILSYFKEEFRIPLAKIHYDMIANMEEVSQRAQRAMPGINIAAAIPRGMAKSTFYSRILPLHGFLYNWSNITVLIGNNTASAARLISNIRTVIESNDALQEDFPNVIGDVWGAERIKNQNGAEIYSFGAGSGGIRGVTKPGSRPKLVIGDDLDDDKSVRSVVETDANCEWWDKSVSQIGDNLTRTTSFIVVGTIIRNRSLLTHILAKPEYRTVKEKGVIQFADRTDLWDEWLTYYNQEKPKDVDHDEYYQTHKDELLEGTQTLWPELPDNYYNMMRVRASSKKAFSSEIQNAPIADGESRFGELGVFSVNSDGLLVPSDRTKVLFPWLGDIPIKECQLHIAVDPTTKGGKNHDYSAIIEILYHKKTETFYVWWASVQQRDYMKLLDDLVRRLESMKRNDYRYAGVYFEENAAGTVVKDLLQQRLIEKKFPTRVIPIHSAGNKLERIEGLSEDTSNGRIIFNTSIDPTLTEQLENFPFEHDDGPDALEIGVRAIRERESRFWYGAM